MKYSFYASAVMLFISTVTLSCKSDTEEDITPQPDPQTQVCQTTNVTYSGTVAGLISSNCLSCHGAGSPSGGVSMDAHARLKQLADNGKLIGTTSHASGFKPMPQGGTKLSDCNIEKIKKWVNAGAPNN